MQAISYAPTFVGKDGKAMALVPAGKMAIGSARGYSEELPVHVVSFDAFYMDTTPVTNAEYKAFCDAKGFPYPENPRWPGMPGYFLNYPDYPAVNVSHENALQYAYWAGKYLPTEEQWEYAAAGGLRAGEYAGPTYPWGDAAPIACAPANYADANARYPWFEPALNDGYRYTSPVGSFAPNGYGLYDMAGNVWEWCEDWFFRYDDSEHDTEPFKDGWGGSHVCRGGCYHSTLFDLRIARRRCILGGQGLISVGFRCVRPADPEAVIGPSKVFRLEKLNPDERWKSKLAGAALPPPKGVELCLGVGKLTPESARHIKALGYTSVEQYVTWQTIENKGRDQWDFSEWDEQVAIMKRVGLKWVPFLIAGPAYAMPDWYRASSDHEGLICLEHGIETRINSIYDKKFYYYIERYLRAFADHYRGDQVVEAPLLGITGDFGEAIFPDWHGNWCTQIPGLYHSHAGYWCGDRYAIEDFREKMRAKYADIAALNAAWGTCFACFDAVEMPPVRCESVDGFRVDEHTTAGKFEMHTAQDRMRWLDFVDWYRASMTEYADFWLKTTRECFPDLPIYLCTGGNAVPWHASDFAQQAKVAAKYGGGVRITNEDSRYATNFAVTNWVTTACRFYGGYSSIEPAGQVTERGVVCRIYNAVANAAHLHFYEGNILGREEMTDTFIANQHYLSMSEVVKPIGAIYPDVAMTLKNLTAFELMHGYALLRDVTDFQFLDDLTIADGILGGMKAAILCGGEYHRRATLDALLDWVKRGGLLVGYNASRLIQVEDGADRFSEFFASRGEKAVGQGHTLFLCGFGLRSDGGDGIVGAKKIGHTLSQSMEWIQENIADPMCAFLRAHGVTVVDGVIDKVYAAQLGEEVLLLNAADGAVSKKLCAPGGDITVEMAYNTMTRVKL